MSSAATPYRKLAADERQELRLPALLKAHIAAAAAQTGETVAEYITAAVAQRVSHDLAEATDWALTVPEQKALLKALAVPVRPSTRARKTAARADSLFGRVARQRRKP